MQDTNPSFEHNYYRFTNSIQKVCSIFCRSAILTPLFIFSFFIYIIFYNIIKCFSWPVSSYGMFGTSGTIRFMMRRRERGQRLWVGVETSFHPIHLLGSCSRCLLRLRLLLHGFLLKILT